MQDNCVLSAILTQLFSERQNISSRTTQIPKGKQVLRDEEKPAPFIQNPDSRSSPRRFASAHISPSRQGHSRALIPNIGRSHRNSRPPNASILNKSCGLATFATTSSSEGEDETLRKSSESPSRLPPVWRPPAPGRGFCGGL